jgi:hypothetical protein
MSLRLLNGAIVATSAPTLATDGFSLQRDTPGAGSFYWLKPWNYGVIQVVGAGTGALTFQGIVYLYSVLAAAWMPAGIGPVADRGKLNDGVTITGTTTLAHTQPIGALSAYERIYLQASTLAGTGMAVNAYLVPQAV